MPDVGATLRDARARKGLSLKQVAAATKIPVHTLELIERNDLHRLPGGIFVRGFLRSYAAEVGLDPDAVVSEFLQQMPPEDAAHGTAREPEAGTREVAEETAFVGRQQMAGVVLRLALVSVPLAIAILYFSSRSRSAPAVRVPEPAVEPPRVEAQALEPVSPAEAEPPPAVAPASAPLVEEQPVLIEIVPTESCWVELAVDGRVAVSRVIAAGEREAHRFARNAVLRVGDAAACAVRLDGRPARPLGRPRQVRQVRITRENYTSFLP